MSAATAPIAAASARPSSPVARRVVWVVLAATAILALALVALSVVPSATLAARLMGAAGEARGGANTQDLMTYLDQRLRIAAGLLLALGVGLAFVWRAFEDLVEAGVLALARVRVSVSTRTLVLVGVPTLIAVALRIPFISQPMRYDEALTFNEFASRPLYYGLSFYPDPNNHLLNTLLMHAAFLGFGNQPWVLRLPAFLGGVLLVPATYWLATELYGSKAAVLAAALVAVSSYLVEYSTNARGYTLQALCFVVMLVLLLRGTRTGLLLAAAVAALGAFAVPTMLYGVAVGAAWWLIEWRRERRRTPGVRHLVAGGLVLGLIVTLLYTPAIVISGPDKLVANRFVVPLTLAELPGELARTLVQTWTFWNRDVPPLFSALLLFGFGATLFFELRQRSVPLGLVALVVCLACVALQRVAPFERVWLFLLPLYLTIAAAGLARFVDGRILAVAFGLVLGYLTLTSGSILSSMETGAFPDAEAIARTLGPRLAPDDAVMTSVPASLPELQYYFPRYGLPIDVLVRPADAGQNLWVIVPRTAGTPVVTGWPSVSEVGDYAGSVLYELKRAPAR